MTVQLCKVAYSGVHQYGLVLYNCTAVYRVAYSGVHLYGRVLYSWQEAVLFQTVAELPFPSLHFSAVCSAVCSAVQ